MKVKKISVLIISILFALITIGCLAGLFSVKKVKVDYIVSDKIDTLQIQSTLNEFVGENLLFLKKDKIENALDKFYYTEVVSVEKSFPNVLKVSVRERKEIYYIKCGEVYAVTTKDGFVLRTCEEEEVLSNTSRDKIVLNLEGIDIVKANVGFVIQTTHDYLLDIVFDMAKSVSLTDCIKSISVFNPNVPGVIVTFNTYSGVDIEISRVEENGVEMAIEAFKAYDSADSDYVKMFSVIKAYMVDDAIKVIWTSSK